MRGQRGYLAKVNYKKAPDTLYLIYKIIREKNVGNAAQLNY
jgi:hypothetical protein